MNKIINTEDLMVITDTDTLERKSYILFIDKKMIDGGGEFVVEQPLRIHGIAIDSEQHPRSIEIEFLSKLV